MTARNRILSIVIPVYNRAGIVGRTLESILSQARIGEVDLILVDNNSTDSTADVLRQYASKAEAEGVARVTVLSEAKPGACAARNRGLAAVDTPWTYFFDSDDTMAPGFIAALLDAIARQAADAAKTLIMWNLDMELPDGKRRETQLVDRQFLWNHLIHAVLATQRYAAPTALFRAVGGWNESLACWNDYELGVRVLLEGPRIEKLGVNTPVTTNFTPESLTGRRHSDSAARRELALDTIAAELQASGVGTDWVDVRRVILAGEYRREKSAAEARRLLKATLASKSLSRRLLLRLLYTKHILYPRGTAQLATLFLRKPADPDGCKE